MDFYFPSLTAFPIECESILKFELYSDLDERKWEFEAEDSLAAIEHIADMFGAESVIGTPWTENSLDITVFYIESTESYTLVWA